MREREDSADTNKIYFKAFTTLMASSVSVKLDITYPDTWCQSIFTIVKSNIKQLTSLTFQGKNIFIYFNKSQLIIY